MADRVSVMIAAQAVALSARTGTLSGHAVEDMRIKAEELLARGDDLRQAVIFFASQYEVLRRDPYGLRLLGEQLEAALRSALDLGASPRRERRDIDG